jgi:hypothetical protein
VRVDDGMICRRRGIVPNRQIAIDEASFQVETRKHPFPPRIRIREPSEPVGQCTLESCRNITEGDVWGIVVQHRYCISVLIQNSTG